ncbi:long-chain fatty acid transporter fat1 [Cichlidogyrus casuarinus]|uniref:Long-chain fatty acid transporter fat1 n=1 Tax=Cichlidogyrus casuarinus TaxID=1844966 RepID=A0ABD2QN27_9PLAT
MILCVWILLLLHGASSLKEEKVLAQHYENIEKNTIIRMLPSDQRRNYTFQLANPSNFVKVDPISGYIRCKVSPDAETLCDRASPHIDPDIGGQIDCADGSVTVNFEVNKAEKGKGIETIYRVSFRVLDQDDNDPRFDKKQHQIELRELIHKSDYQIILPKASDADIDQKNQRICYTDEVEDAHSKLAMRDFLQFSVSNGEPTLTLLKDADAEEYSKIEFFLLAKAASSSDFDAECSRNSNDRFDRFDRLNVTITIKDMNDNPPTFEQSLYKLSLSEDSPPDNIILKVSSLSDSQNKPVSFW